ncbi:hypothetical protein [Allonocardiopsis opalescens]|uniref:Uncharacterized protein n=1 Tax=Allonocardiopsis opalescens TaxID=1144618 RepID=A0A2T0QCE4_9ACTN|nr:hypothetical protein [Allonocardiopsis opalescens]PRY01587.1 hypothetical protein CLV72_101170 [Allonocardiopsis opalescens]
MRNDVQHEDDELAIAVEEIAAVRSRAEQPSDGGGTGKSDLNDNMLR